MNSRSAAIILCSLLPITLASCTSTTDDAKHYLLSSTTDNATALCDLTIGHISIPAYLRGSGIIVQTGASELTSATSHRWSEPLTEGIRRVLSRCMDGSSGQVVNIDVRHFHGNTNGQTVLEAQWAYPPAGVKGQLKESIQQSGEGYEPLVASHRQLLGMLCDKVCANRPRPLR